MNIPGSKLFFLLLTVLLLVMLNVSVVMAEKTIGVIMTGGIPYYQDIHDSFMKTLRNEGLVSDNTKTILQTPIPTTMAWTNTIRKFVAFDVDLIVSYGAPATEVALDEVSDIPIVFAGVFDPNTLNLTGRKATGISSHVPIISLLKYLKEIVDYSTLGIIYSESEKDTVFQADLIAQNEARLQFRSKRFNITGAEDVSGIGGIDALFFTTSCSAMHCKEDIIDVSHRARIPTASVIGGGEQAGVILTISANPEEQGSEVARLAARVAQGAKPSSLPVKKPKKVDVIINMKEATSIGVKIPFDLLTSATKVIK
jgi:putative ABC transport system substrate-binding protein